MRNRHKMCVKIKVPGDLRFSSGRSQSIHKGPGTWWSKCFAVLPALEVKVSRVTCVHVTGYLTLVPVQLFAVSDRCCRRCQLSEGCLIPTGSSCCEVLILDVFRSFPSVVFRRSRNSTRARPTIRLPLCWLFPLLLMARAVVSRWLADCGTTSLLRSVTLRRRLRVLLHMPVVRSLRRDFGLSRC